MPLRILLVDDSPEFLESAARWLDTDPRIEVAGRMLSGRAVVEQVSRLRPDLVLMDIAMPDVTGLEATRLLKMLPDPPSIVILTLHDTPEYRAAARAVGADGFVNKIEFATQLLPLLCVLFGEPLTARRK